MGDGVQIVGDTGLARGDQQPTARAANLERLDVLGPPGIGLTGPLPTLRKLHRGCGVARFHVGLSERRFSDSASMR